MMGFTSPKISERELLGYYPSSYEAYNKRKGIMSFLQKMKYKRDLKIISRSITKNKPSMFEIGAGRGEFLQEARKAGFNVSGVEPGEEGVIFAKKEYNLKIICGFAKDMPLKSRYDVIVLRHVLEHINNPKDILLYIKDKLKDKGVLFIKIPNYGSAESALFKRYWGSIDAPRHRVHFTKNGIKKLLKDIGYKDILIRKEIVPNDIIRSIEFWGRYSNSRIRTLGALFSKLPEILKIIIGQIIGAVLSIRSSGRMIITARLRD
ncbi:MAG: class I SAM-dependent methyltransferase [Nanoarchaeota archaeon]|nr:class I SAM-dependent methyltransferase [Nanoarchaeota archaeon]MBU1703900.1 class I SAM-dependent methyltransferase [Nanoarchaeota archaeon]